MPNVPVLCGEPEKNLRGMIRRLFIEMFDEGSLRFSHCERVEESMNPKSVCESGCIRSRSEGTDNEKHGFNERLNLEKKKDIDVGEARRMLHDK